MDVFEFIKKYCPVGNGDLIILYAFKKGWKITTIEIKERLKLSYNHAYNILKKMETAGFCKCIKRVGKQADIYEFNGSGKYLIKRIFERKIMPYVNITPEEFLNIEEVEIALKFN